MTSLEAFAAYLRDNALAAGYRVDRRRGKRALAQAARMSYDDLAATLNARHCPGPYELEHLAEALGVSLVTLLVDSGTVRPYGSEAAS